MNNAVEVKFDYGGMDLICDDEAFGRLCEHLSREPMVSKDIGDPSGLHDLRFISIRRTPARVPTDRLSRGALVLMILGATLSGFVMIVGLVTIVRWGLQMFNGG